VKRDSVEVRRFAGPGCYAFAPRLRVAHLTDQHVGRVTPHSIQREAIRLTNAQQPDFIALTGDFVGHSTHYLDVLTELLSQLNAPAYAVLGNHDYWAGAEEVAAALAKAGVTLLRNAHTQIYLKGQALQIVGLDDAYTGHANLEEAVKGLDPQVPALGLSHIPEEADALWSRGVPFVLSGHTHGGQITVARLHELSLGRFAGHRYVHGLYGNRAADRSPFGTQRGAVYVSAGIGASVVPFRLGERGKREVAVFDLGTPPGTIAEHHAEQTPLPGRPPSERKQRQRHARVLRKQDKRQRRAAKDTSHH